MTLVFAVMHLCNIFNFFIASVHSFFYTFLKSGICKVMEWSMIQACPCVMCFFNRGGTEGTTSLKILCLMLVYVLFYVNLCTGLIFVVFELFVV